ncbi:MAG: CdaR family protein [Bryobacteraceae bacterium]|jgi:YbbR domain-containing protein
MKFLTHNIGWKLLALAAAFGVWFNVASEPELETIFSAPVQYKNYPKDLEISSNIVEAIDIEARGPSGQLRTLTESQISAIVDFSSVNDSGERTFTLTQKELKLPRGIELVRTIPAQLRFTFEHRATRALKVEVPTSGTLPPGLSIASIEADPPELSIAGPASRVAAVKKAVSDPLDLNQVKGDSQQVLAVYIPEPEVRFLTVPRVTVKVHVVPAH